MLTAVEVFVVSDWCDRPEMCVEVVDLEGEGRGPHGMACWSCRVDWTYLRPYLSTKAGLRAAG